MITLTDGTHRTHDGYVMAVDSGGAIKDRHIDFFEGPQDRDVLLSALSQPFAAYRVTDARTIEFLAKLHRRSCTGPAPAHEVSAK